MPPRSHSAYNTSDHPVVIDPDGRQIDGGARDKVDPDEPLVLAGKRSGALILTADRAEPGDPAGQPSADQLEAAAQATTAAPAKAARTQRS